MDIFFYKIALGRIIHERISKVRRERLKIPQHIFLRQIQRYIRSRIRLSCETKTQCLRLFSVCTMKWKITIFTAEPVSLKTLKAFLIVFWYVTLLHRNKRMPPGPYSIRIFLVSISRSERTFHVCNTLIHFFCVRQEIISIIHLVRSVIQEMDICHC